MNYGRLRCLGSQTRLKAKFGEGYQLKFHCRSGRIREVERYVQANVPSARHMETYAGEEEREGERKRERERERGREDSVCLWCSHCHFLFLT